MNLFLQGDCLRILPTFPAESVDMVLTDPPYLVNYKDRSGRSIINDLRDDWLNPAFSQLFRVLRPDSFCVSFYGWTRVDRFFAAWRQAGFRPVGHVVFSKSYASSAKFVQYRHEAAFLLAKGSPELPVSPPPDVLPWEYTGNPLHPTQKPVSALRPLIEAFTKPGAIVLDPFAGSGSSCIAAASCGRRYVGVEMDPRYFALAKGRLAAEQRRPHSSDQCAADCQEVDGRGACGRRN